MIRFKIHVETEHSMFYLHKEYERISDLLKAIEMINWDKQQPCVVTAHLFRDDYLVQISEPLTTIIL
jgi:hypothetical protein